MGHVGCVYSTAWHIINTQIMIGVQGEQRMKGRQLSKNIM